ncbi:4-hydroxy-tetrahydrodipicolinate reductase [Blattabacterium cuenoti]|uniref:4-hydroxy-tetrahydrodipicolinate reductase n=1 Tax=Blattabacterium cuenoti TaxID=1653831 RepID=UPI00163D007D|nr:4-hydroxy-tetrahydrodipicolinate reductase [Blattabacterium cuenoti]
MNIAIIGYGKMGKTIKKIAISRNHKIKLCCDSTPQKSNLLDNSIDVAIEFSQPNSAFENIKICIDNNVPVVSGTTGWLDKLNEIKKICIKKNGSFLYSSNFSIGMNIFYEINKKLSKLLFPYSKEYSILIEEIHHKDKKDKPSGTSIHIAKDIIDSGIKNNWNLDDKKFIKNDKKSILIKSKRFKNIIGEHIVNYKSYIEKISIRHKAYNRNIFAIGAIISAEWLFNNKNKKGIFSMKNVLDL